MATLFSGIATASARVTRLRADLAHAALEKDLLMQASANQGELSNLRQITKEQGQPLCPVYSGCTQTGTAPRDQVLGSSGGSGGGTFTCAMGSTAGSAWMGVGLGFAAVAVAQAVRRRRR